MLVKITLLELVMVVYNRLGKKLLHILLTLFGEGTKYLSTTLKVNMEEKPRPFVYIICLRHTLSAHERKMFIRLSTDYLLH